MKRARPERRRRPSPSRRCLAAPVPKEMTMCASPSDHAAGLSREAVVWAYRLLLDREPESEAVIEQHRRHPDIQTLRDVFLGSDEFRLRKIHEFKQNGPLSWLSGRWVAAPVLGGSYLIWIDLGDAYVSLGCLLDNYEPAVYSVSFAAISGYGVRYGLRIILKAELVLNFDPVIGLDIERPSARYANQAIFLLNLEVAIDWMRFYNQLLVHLTPASTYR